MHLQTNTVNNFNIKNLAVKKINKQMKIYG